jgi:hypothetical protein
LRAQDRVKHMTSSILQQIFYEQRTAGQQLTSVNG